MEEIVVADVGVGTITVFLADDNLLVRTGVRALLQRHPDLEIVFLEKHVCYCATMNRIDLPHLVWALENLAQGHVVNQITVDPETERYAKAALQRMLDLPGETARD